MLQNVPFPANAEQPLAQAAELTDEERAAAIRSNADRNLRTDSTAYALRKQAARNTPQPIFPFDCMHTTQRTENV